MDRREGAKIPKSLLQGRYRAAIAGAMLNFSVYWARTVNSERESLLTHYTRHTFYELQCVINGQIVMRVGEKRVPVAAGEIIVVPPDTFHQVEEADSVGARFIMAFSITAADDSFHGAIEAMEDVQPKKITPFFQQLLDFLLDMTHTAGDARVNHLLLEALIVELLFIMKPSRQSDSTAPNIQTNQQKYVSEILAFIREKHGVNIHIAQLAQRAALSERHLSRIFKEETGMTLKEAINYEKLRHIEDLVVTTNLSLNEISEICGFSDEYGMNKFFRRYNRVNLSEYRRVAKR